MSESQYDVILSSVNVHESKIKKALYQCRNIVIYITTNSLFLHEKEALARLAPKKKIIFKNFRDFLNDADLERIDSDSHFTTDNKSMSPYELDKYYYRVSLKKNLLVSTRILKRYKPQKRIILSNELGIVDIPWLNSGYRGSYSTNHMEINLRHHFTLGAVRDLLICNNFYRISNRGNSYVFIGQLTRIYSRLSSKVRIESKLNRFIHTNLNNLRIIPNIVKYYFSHTNLRGFSDYHINKILDLYTDNTKKKVILATTIHEYSKIPLHLLKHVIARKLVILQDGYWPDNYSSRYLSYYKGVDKFLTWDRLSLKLPKSYKYSCEKSSLFHETKLPTLKSLKKVRKIVIASSTSGDWTALKSRSDDDKLAEFSLKLANKFPKIQFIYRAHPFMNKTEIHGNQAFSRLIRLFNYSKYNNIVLSNESIQGVGDNLYVKPESFEKDIEGADIVIGEHSIAMIDAAMKAKIWIALNITNRRNLFQSYTNLGFLYAEKMSDIIRIINSIDASDLGLLNQINRAINRYNKEYS